MVHPSIDSFTDAHKANEGIVKTCHLAVAWVLRRKEFAPNKFYNGKRDWMSYLLRGMFEGVNRQDPTDFFNKHKAFFATFNYDRTLEHFISTRLVASYANITQMYVDQMLLSKIEIHHIYGDLGKYDPANTRTDNLLPADFLKSAESIEMMYSARGKHKTVVARVIDLFRDCQQIGFGFDQQNIDLLGFNAGVTPGRLVAATKYDLTLTEWVRAKGRLGQTAVTHSTENRDGPGK